MKALRSAASSRSARLAQSVASQRSGSVDYYAQRSQLRIAGPHGCEKAPIGRGEIVVRRRRGQPPLGNQRRHLKQRVRGVDFYTAVPATPPHQLLDDLASFQRVLFTNHRVRELADAVNAGTSLPDPDPPLNESAG